MASSAPYSSKAKEGWIRVFCPYSRSLSSEEISSIPREEKKRTEADDEGVWLEVQCPEEKCLTGKDKITITVRGVEPREDEGLWHKLFCPEDRCFAQTPVDLP